jgi:hypothetical protein
VTGQPEIHQFECRWQPTADLSPVAASSTHDYILAWYERLARSIRPALPGAGVPAASVRYEIFPDGTAALAWRQWSGDAIALQDDTDRRPLVARILVGDAQLLTPEVAVVISHTGMPDVIGLPPGQVSAGTVLPPIDPRDLFALVRDVTDRLDQQAGAEPGLNSVIAAALSSPHIALSVQLPEAAMRLPPQGGPQAPLLWGLRRTVWPLLADQVSGYPGWSFSTYEPPLGEGDTRTLTDIVFRTATKVAQAPLSTRREVTVWLRDPDRAPAPTPNDDLAVTLVAAFRDVGGEALVHNLATIAQHYPEMEGRLRATYGSLLTLPTPGPRSARRAEPIPVPRRIPSMAPGAPGVPAIPAEVEAPADLSPPPLASPEAPLDPAVMPSPAHRLAPGRMARPAEPPPAGVRTAAMPDALADVADDTQPPFPAGRRDERGSSYRLPGICVLLDRLYAGPGDPEFAAVRHAILTLRQLPVSGDRAAARKLMPERDWYLSALRTDDRWHIAQTLEAIFRLTVIPDLRIPEVTEELNRWAYEMAAPVPVIIALSDAARRSGDSEQALMKQALCLALGQRWMAERGIYATADVGIAKVSPRVGRAVQESSDLNPFSRLVANRAPSEIVALVLAIFCALLIVMLAVEILR